MKTREGFASPTESRPNPKSSPEILFATVAVGGRHIAAARAMAEAVELHYPGQLRTRVSDYMGEVGPRSLDHWHKHLRRLALRHPRMSRTGQAIIDFVPRATVATQRQIMRPFARRAARLLSESPPDLIVSNHGLLTSGLSLARERYGLRVPLLAFATEPHNVCAYWADPGAGQIAVPSQEVRANLLSLGVPDDQISVLGYPVRQAFLNPPGKREARARLGLEDRFTCLVSLGVEGVAGDPVGLVRALLESEAAPQVIVITGRNDASRDSLLAFREARCRDSCRLRVEGLADNMAEFVAASDVVAGRANPASVYEALAVGRPVLATGYGGLNERAVLHFLEWEGLGRLVKDHSELASEVSRYAADPAALSAVAQACAGLRIGEKTTRLAHYLAGYALHAAGGAEPVMPAPVAEEWDRAAS